MARLCNSYQRPVCLGGGRQYAFLKAAIRERREFAAKGASSVSCANYVLDFLNGALLTDTAIIESLKKEPSEFMKRVYKTRDYRSRITPPSTLLVQFCLPEPLVKKYVVDEIIANLSAQVAGARDVDEVVYMTLNQSSPVTKARK